MTETPAEMIERAAALMRERAEASWPGPWDLETEVGGFGPVACVLMPLPGHKGARTGLTSYIPLGTQDAETAAHIASWHPLVALAVADWLHQEAINAGAYANHGNWLGVPSEHALKIACAYLGETAEAS